MPTKPPTDLVGEVRGLVVSRIERIGSWAGHAADTKQLLPGKMLRTRLAQRLMECESVRIEAGVLKILCAASELVHTASLCHDDVIDNALIRRSHPTLWWSSGASAAVLIGDLLLCEAI
ncbi:MAG: polyprenyl synthetase family protein, partial [Planctomycetota bacterium]